MKKQSSPLLFFEAVATLMGATIGAGILAIPYSISKTGLVVGLIVMVCICLFSALRHLMMAEIVLRTSDSHQLPGYIGKYLGKKWKFLSSLAFMLTAFGALLAYIIGEGKVLSALFGGSAYLWSFVFTFFGSIAILFGLHIIKKSEGIMTLCVLAIVVLLGWQAFDKIQLSHFVYSMPSQWITPYGVLIFAFSGAVAIPQMRTILAGRERLLKPAMFVGTSMIFLVYLVFTILVLGVTGLQTTDVATIGLGRAIGPLMVMIGNTLALFTMGTSFLAMGLGLRQMFEYDYGLSKWIAWGLTVGIPLLLFVLGLQDFTKSIALVGGVFITILTVGIVLTFWKAKETGDREPEFHMGKMPIVGAGLIFIALVGALFTILKLL